jgi:hypothetical protein
MSLRPTDPYNYSNAVLNAQGSGSPRLHPHPLCHERAPVCPTSSARVASSTSLVNKTGTLLLYQQCSYAFARLLRIDSMPAFFSLSNSSWPTPHTGPAMLTSQDDDGEVGMRKLPRESVLAHQSTDQVRQLWDTLALGVPLCILYNAQPGIQPLQIDAWLRRGRAKAC